MNENLSALLENAGDAVPVGPVPLESIVRAARRTRLRRRVGAALGAAAVVAAAVVGTALVTSGSPSAEAPQPVVTPDGMRLVGIGHAAIAVPDDWGTNDTTCGRPMHDTVIIDEGSVGLCLYVGGSRTSTPDSVRIETHSPLSTLLVANFEIDGVAAQRSAPRCTPAGQAGRQLVPYPSYCSATLYVPSENAYFTAESRTVDEVDAILGRIRVLPDLIAVPGFQTFPHPGVRDGATAYVEALRGLGLDVEVRAEPRPDVPRKDVRATDPAPGTMLRPGNHVTVTELVPPGS